MNTGKADISKLGSIQNFNYLNHNKYYSSECSKLSGSTGELFQPNQERNSMTLFVPDMGRSMKFDYEKDVEVHGVTGFRFQSGARAIDDGVKFPENSCYNEGSAKVMPSGVMNISSCRYGSPVFMSSPHFYAADPFYLNQVEGLAPSKENHESYFTLEPVSYY